MLKRPAFYLDTQICTGCMTCIVACIDKNDLELGVRWRRVIEYSGGQWRSMSDGLFRQDIFVHYISISCNHCLEPICVDVCPTSAMHQDEYGIVTVDQNKCTGCNLCRDACPYDAPQYILDSDVMGKCDFCRDTLLKGGIPSCVVACPTRALRVGEFEELRQVLGVVKNIPPLPDHGLTEPCAFFRPKKMSTPGSRV